LLLLALLAFMLFLSNMLLLYILDCRIRRISLSDSDRGKRGKTLKSMCWYAKMRRGKSQTISKSSFKICWVYGETISLLAEH
jgi:hypothetical protein